ncbi:glucosidase II beta subunit-like protein-domain-containing protein [Limtongia smithiae]|uniref:glucosidase II beta subunit-like protein-domain-containing protein n=1 Tax=Limtongia smithiae TaxID=1125753 RepID=UPI0034CE2DBE
MRPLRTMLLHAAVSAMALLARPSVALFSVQDDILAFPQYQIYMTNDYITELDAAALMTAAPETDTTGKPPIYEIVTLQHQKFLCALPVLEPQAMLNASQKELSKSEEERELSRAQTNGWDLLEPLSGTCLYYDAGWWTYSFCHKVEVKQFHQLIPRKGSRPYPPKEDPNNKSYILGRVAERHAVVTAPGDEGAATHQHQPLATASLVVDATVQAAGEIRYLVQKLGGGTVCDLTGRERKIEIQFHCNKNPRDKIAWIKEVTTCRYLMVIHTRRLCQDAAFLPPKENSANEIRCQHIITEEENERRKEQATLEADILSAMDDHDILGAEGAEEAGADAPPTTPAAGSGDATTPTDKEFSNAAATETALSSGEVAASTTTEAVAIDGAGQDDDDAAGQGPDLATSASMLIRDIQRQIAEGTFLTPAGTVATEEDSFSYMVALEDVNGQVIGIVTVVVDGGQVEVLLDEERLGVVREDDKAGVLSKFPQKLMNDLREFSGGLGYEDLHKALGRGHDGLSGLWEDDEEVEVGAFDDSEDEDEHGSTATAAPPRAPGTRAQG